MPKQIFGAESVVITLNRAFNDQSPSNATFNNQVATAGTTTDSQMAFAKQYGAGYAGQTADALSTLILGNLGVLPNDALQTALKDYITAAGVANIGIIALQLGDILSGLENASGDQAGFKAAALAWNSEVTDSYNYSSNPNNNTPSNPGVPNPGSSAFVLTGGIDTADVAGAFRNGQGGNAGTPSNFKFSSANETVTATNANLQASDSLADATTTDNDVLSLTLTGNIAAQAATVTNIETINIATSGSTQAGTVNFANVTGAKTVTLTGAPGVFVTLQSLANTGVTSVDGSALSSAVNGVSASFVGSTSTAALTLKGGIAGDFLAGAGGADNIDGGDGNDYIIGGAGADTLNGDAGNDRISGGTNNDTINGGSGIDLIDGGLGNDTIDAGTGSDLVVTGGGNDKVTGGAGDDLIVLGTVAGGTLATATASGTATAITYSEGFKSITDGGVTTSTPVTNADFTNTGNGGTTPALIVTGVGTNTVTFADTAANNGNDIIRGFGVSAATGGVDVLNVSAYVGAETPATFASTVAAGLVNPGAVGYTAAAGENVIALETSAGAGQLDADTNGLLSVAELQASSLKIGNNGKAVVLYDNGTDTVVYYVATDANGAYASASQVATLVGVDATGLVAGNFA